MAIIEFRIEPKQIIEFEEGYVTFIRNEQSSKNVLIPYKKASGQSFTAGQILVESGINGNQDYVAVKVVSNVTIVGSGNLEVQVINYPYPTQLNKVIFFDIDFVMVRINASYNSSPVTEDFSINNIPNRTTIPLGYSYFTPHYSDFDGDAMAQISISGDVSSLQYNGVPYVASTYVDFLQISNIIFVPKDQDTYYEQDNTWRAKDSYGNRSVSSNLKFKEFGKTCTPPILISATNSTEFDFNLVWSYDGSDYSLEDPPSELIIFYSIDGGVNFIPLVETYAYNQTSASINIPSIEWESIIFKVLIQTRDCSEYSNQITISI